ncbi:MAG: hypothetical protein KDM64_09295 [Verrucomicrobiae bacterium]|nr:hypothetical protein [Verrucomicrobiae bacterium]
MADDTPPASDTTAPAPAPDPGAGSSPVPGCIILITALVVFGLLATVFTVVFHKQSRLIDGFTVAAPTEVPRMTPTQAQINDANRKLEDLLLATARNEMDRVTFTADDLNTLIATQDLLADFRGQTFIRSISDKGIEAEMSQPLRSGFLRQGLRYLNGVFRVKPELTGGTVVFKVVDIEVTGKEVPEGFVQSYPAFMKIDPKLSPFDQVLPKLDRVYVEGDKVVVETRVALLR